MSPYLWLSDQDRTADVVNALRKIQEEAGIQEIYSGESWKLLFNAPRMTPVCQISLFSRLQAKSTWIAAARSSPSMAATRTRIGVYRFSFTIPGSAVKKSSFLYNVTNRPSILRALGLNPFSLDALRIEKTPFLPGLDFGQLQRSVPSPGKK